MSRSPADAAARIKTDRNGVRDKARIKDFLAKVKVAAQVAGLSERIDEPVLRLLIERSIAHELDRWDALRSAN